MANKKGGTVIYNDTLRNLVRKIRSERLSWNMCHPRHMWKTLKPKRIRKYIRTNKLLS